jgi:hypothetical protein
VIRVAEVPLVLEHGFDQLVGVLDVGGVFPIIVHRRALVARRDDDTLTLCLLFRHSPDAGDALFGQRLGASTVVACPRVGNCDAERVSSHHQWLCSQASTPRMTTLFPRMPALSHTVAL